MITRLLNKILLLMFMVSTLHALTETELLKIRITYLNDHIGTYAEYEVINSIKETVEVAQKNNLDVSLILTQLKNHAQNQMKLHTQKLKRTIKNPGEFIFGTTLTSAGVVCMACMHKYELYKKNQLQNAYDELSRNLQALGVNINETVNRYVKYENGTWINVTDITINFARPPALSSENNRYIDASSARMVDLRKQMKSSTENDWTSTVGAGGLLMGILGIPFIYNALFPHWQDKYHQDRREDETALKNFATLIKEIDLILSDIDTGEKL